MEVIFLFKRLSDNLTNRLVIANETTVDEVEIYSYGFEYLFSLSMSLVVIVIITLILDVKLEALGFVIGFSTLRGSTGGLHNKTHLACQLTSFSVFLMAMLITKYTGFLTPSIILMVSVLICFVIFEMAPIEHVNRPLSHKEFTKFKSMSRIKVVVLSYICLLGYMFIDLRNFFIGMLLSMIIVTISVFLSFMLEGKVL